MCNAKDHLICFAAISSSSGLDNILEEEFSFALCKFLATCTDPDHRLLATGGRLEDLKM